MTSNFFSFLFFFQCYYDFLYGFCDKHTNIHKSNHYYRGECERLHLPLLLLSCNNELKYTFFPPTLSILKQSRWVFLLLLWKPTNTNINHYIYIYIFYIRGAFIWHKFAKTEDFLFFLSLLLKRGNLDRFLQEFQVPKWFWSNI